MSGFELEYENGGKNRMMKEANVNEFAFCVIWVGGWNGAKKND